MIAPVADRRVPAWPARHPLLAFTGPAYALSWICWLPLLADRQGWVGWSASPYLHLLGGLGPAAIPRLARTRRSDRPRSDRPHIDRPHIDRVGSFP